MTTDVISEQIAAAKAAAASHTAQQGTALTTGPTAGGLPSTGLPATGFVPGKRLEDEDMLMSSISVDFWFKPKEFGLLIGKNDELVPSFIGILDLNEILRAIRIKAGNPAKYWTTYDGCTSRDGGTWDQAIAKAKAIDPSAGVYNSVDLPITTLEDIVVGDKVLAKAGQRGGYATSTTNWGNWDQFYQICKNKGFNPKDANSPSRVKLKVGFQKRVNSKGNVWGLCTFEFIEMIEDAGE